jgi:hypothetical protein
MKLVIFKCPECGNNLEFKENSVLYPCKNCNLWFEVENGLLSPVVFLTPPVKDMIQRALIALPFRLFKVAPLEGFFPDKGKSTSEFTIWIESFDYSSIASEPRNHPGLSLSASGKKTENWKELRHVPNLITCSKTRSQCMELLVPYFKVLSGSNWERIEPLTALNIVSIHMVALPFLPEKNTDLLFQREFDINSYEKTPGFSFTINNSALDSSLDSEVNK